MSIIAISTSEAVLGQADARRLTDKIKSAVDTVWELISQAYSERAWSALGYASWDDYCQAEFGTTRLRLPREERAEVVASLRESGLSLRAIEAATGVSRPTIIKDLGDAQVVNSLPPEPPGAVTDETPGQTDRVAAALERARRSAADDPEQPAPEIVGMDGKKYKKSGTKKKPPVAAGLQEEEAKRGAARVAELSAWGTACDGLLAALSYAASSTPPEDTGSYPAVETFIERYEKLGDYVSGWPPHDWRDGYDRAMGALLGDLDESVELLADDAEGALAACRDHLIVAAALLGHAVKIGNLESIHPVYARSAVKDLDTAEAWVLRLMHPAKILRDEDGSASAMELFNDAIRDGGEADA